MPKYTKKWEKDFEKRYSNAIKELQSLEKEYKEMTDTNPDKWIRVYPKETQIEFGENNGFYVSHYKENEQEDSLIEHINVTLESQLGMFGFQFTSLQQLIDFRNKLIEEIDKFQRPIENKKMSQNDECEEDDENWEENEYQEYTIQASRTLVEVWTHTVQARSSCEAYRLVQEDSDGSTNDENSDYRDHGEIEWEII